MRAFRVLALAGAMSVASPALALTTLWDYNVTSYFTGTTNFTSGYSGAVPGLAGPAVCGPVIGNPNTSNTAPAFCLEAEKLSWGVPDTINGQSYLQITGNPGLGPIATTPEGEVPGGLEIGFTQTFVHNNYPIWSPFLLNTNVITTLDLNAVLPDPSTSPDPFPPLTFIINFAETPNQGSGNPAVCADGAAVPLAGCPDIFVLSAELLDFAFTYAGNNYIAHIIPDPFGKQLDPLSPAECAAAGVTHPCGGFITPENEQTTVKFGFYIEDKGAVVPEPGILALFALGLVGLGFTVRRRQV